MKSSILLLFGIAVLVGGWVPVVAWIQDPMPNADRDRIPTPRETLIGIFGPLQADFVGRYRGHEDEHERTRISGDGTLEFALDRWGAPAVMRAAYVRRPDGVLQGTIAAVDGNPWLAEPRDFQAYPFEGKLIVTFDGVFGAMEFDREEP